MLHLAWEQDLQDWEIKAYNNISLQYNYLGKIEKALSYNLRGMNGVVEKKDSKVKEIVSNMLRNKWDFRKVDSDMSNSEIEDGYDSDEDLNSKFVVSRKTPLK